MKIGFLLLKMLQFYVLKMAAIGGRHFEINSETKQKLKLNLYTIFLNKYSRVNLMIKTYFTDADVDSI